MIRILTFICGLFGAAGLSQFPEFSQQYLQRLAGAVDELGRVVGDFDRSAEGVGMSREQALAALSGGEFQEQRREDMTRTIARSERLSADLAALREAPMALRALQPQRFTDPEIARAAWADFKPALPITPTGFGFGGAGFALGLILAWPLFRLLGWPFRALRRRGREEAAAPRAEAPPLQSPAPKEAGPRAGLPIGWLARTNAEAAKIVQEGAALDVFVMAIEPGARHEVAAGPACDMVLLVADGSGALEEPSARRTIETGQLAMLAPRSKAALVNLGDAPFRVIGITQKSKTKPA